MPVRPKLKSSGPKKVDALTVAEDAVSKYNEELLLLREMKKKFKEDFPDANTYLQDIMVQEDLVQSRMQEAIPLVREARQTVGDFQCMLKKSTPNYDAAEFSKLVTEIEEGGEILIELIEGGYVKKLVLDPSAAAYFAQHPEAADHFQSAWRDAKDLTPAITPPKI
jgi:hypothetical protein